MEVRAGGVTRLGQGRVAERGRDRAPVEGRLGRPDEGRRAEAHGDGRALGRRPMVLEGDDRQTRADRLGRAAWRWGRGGGRSAAERKVCGARGGKDDAPVEAAAGADREARVADIFAAARAFGWREKGWLKRRREGLAWVGRCW